MANFITILRVLIVFLSVFLLTLNDRNAYIVAFGLTIIAFWFDGLDGFIARKFNLSTKLGAVLDIMGDRIVENAYWITFAVLGWIPLCVPIIILSRGIITDSLRSVAMEQGLTAFGESSMQTDKIGRFLCASNFSRGLYAVAKALAFLLLIAGFSNVFGRIQSDWLVISAYIFSFIAIELCVLRGLPVVLESKRFFQK